MKRFGAALAVSSYNVRLCGYHPGDTAPLFGEVKPDPFGTSCYMKECLNGTRM